MTLYTLAQKESFMRQALHEAERALTAGNLPIGAVIVVDGEVVARGRNHYITGHPTRHAEMEAVRSLPGSFERQQDQAAIFSSAEPCYMCYGAILVTSITHVFYAAPDVHFGASQVHGHGRYGRERIHTWEGGILESEAFALMLRYSERFCRLHFGERFEMLREQMRP